MSGHDRLTTREYWQDIYATKLRLSLPTKLRISTRNIQNLLSRHIKPGMSVIEIGFAPGKQLSYVAKKYQAQVTGLDYSKNGVDQAKRLFNHLGIKATFVNEDIFKTTLANDSYDIVYSVGLVEHFTEPQHIIRKHVDLAKPGATVLILIPDYGGIYGKLQKYFDSPNLDLHNTSMMTVTSYNKLAPYELLSSCKCYKTGVIDPGYVNLTKRMNRRAAKLLHYVFTLISFVQPFPIDTLAPLLVLEMKKKK